MRYPTELDTNLYNRQQNIKLLEYKHAIVIGVGGIGSWVAFNLAMSGKIKNLHIIDPDDVEESNLNRTPFRFCDIGQPKVIALKYLILERRAIDVFTYQKKTSKALFNELYKLTVPIKDQDDIARISDNAVVIDCRDDAINDFFEMPYKYYKLGYDGLSATLDGNPRNTAVWGNANTYQFTPSFICPAQLVANLAVIDILTDKLIEEDKKNLPKYDTITNTNNFDMLGRFNKVITFDVKEIIEVIYREMKSREESH